MFHKSMLLFVVAVIALVAPSRADAIVFDFAGATSSVPSITFVQEGLGVVATGWTEGSVLRHVHRDANGLGVTFSGDRATDGSASQIDGRGMLESLLLTFDQVVTLDDVTFGLMEENDGYRLLVDGIEGGRMGRVFDFTVSGADDDYKVKGLSVSASPVSTAGVPEPGTALLLGVGLGIAALRRRLADWATRRPGDQATRQEGD